MPASTRLLSAKSPWVYLLPLKPGQTAESVLKPPATLVVKTLNGHRCRTKAQLLHELAATLSFPDYFDPNWDSVEECLSDLEWLPGGGYLLVIRQADETLADDAHERATWLSILRSVGKYWASQVPPKPFRAMLAVEADTKAVPKEWQLPRWKNR